MVCRFSVIAPVTRKNSAPLNAGIGRLSPVTSTQSQRTNGWGQNLGSLAVDAVPTPGVSPNAGSRALLGWRTNRVYFLPFSLAAPDSSLTDRSATLERRRTHCPRTPGRGRLKVDADPPRYDPWGLPLLGVVSRIATPQVVDVVLRA